MSAWIPGAVILGEYTIEKELGHGGMGRVWLVRSNSTGRHFAVKQVLVNDDKSRKAFLAELQTWIDLPEHPNIVPCRFFRTVGDEIVIFTDYIEGGSLADWIAKRKLTTLEQILDVAIQFARGLQAIHERGLVHQDVKPGNVLMTADGVPMVADFGLARARQVVPSEVNIMPAELHGQHSVYVPGAGLLTKEYASPEQRAGKPLSCKTDIWSWGVSVLDMFMGGVSCPHGGHIAAEVLEAFIEHGSQEEGMPIMPEGVATFVRKCFAMNPAERWHTKTCAICMAVRYKQYVGHAHQRSAVQSQSPMATPFRHDRQVFRRAKWDNPRKWLQKAYVANGRDPTDADTYQVPAAYSRKGAAVADLAIYEEAERQFKAALSVWSSKIAERLANLLSNKAVVCDSLDDVEGCINSAEQCIAIYQRLVEQEGRQDLANKLAEELLGKAEYLICSGNLAAALQESDKSIAIMRRLVENEGRREYYNTLAQALHSAGDTLWGMGNLAGSIEYYNQCIEIHQRMLAQGWRNIYDDSMAMALISRANAYHSMGNYTAAINDDDKSIAIYRRIVDLEWRSGKIINLGLLLWNKAGAVFETGDVTEAIKIIDESIATFRRIIDQEEWPAATRWFAMATMSKGVMLLNMGDLAKSEEYLSRSVNILLPMVEQEGRRALAADLAAALIAKGNVLQRMGNSEGSLALYDKGIAIYQQLVEQGGRHELLGDLAKCQIERTAVKKSIQTLTDEEYRKGLEAYRTLANEAQRTGRSDLLELTETMAGLKKLVMPGSSA